MEDGCQHWGGPSKVVGGLGGNLDCNTRLKIMHLLLLLLRLLLQLLFLIMLLFLILLLLPLLLLLRLLLQLLFLIMLLFLILLLLPLLLLPSTAAVEEGARGLAMYATVCQRNG